MKIALSKFTPIYLIVDLFIITAVFVAMAAAFMIVLQTYNNNQVSTSAQLSSFSD